MARPTKHAFRYKNVGRPTKMTEEVVKKLEEAASLRASVREMCFYANISVQTYYDWMKANPQLLERLDELRQKAILLARQTIIGDIPKNVGTAFRFLEKEKPEEYGDRLKIEHSGELTNLEPGVHQEDEMIRKEFREKLRANMKKRWIEKEEAKKATETPKV